MYPESASAAEEARDADGVDDVVDVEAVARALLAPHARERAVQTVAKPVHREAERDQQEADRRDSSQPVRRPAATIATSASTVR